jgi:aminomethyltransferase
VAGPPKVHGQLVTVVLNSQAKGQRGRQADRVGLLQSRLPFCLFNFMSLKHTPLHAIHAASGAKLVDFGGWEMPLNYGSQIQEHHAVRTDAGMFDVSHMFALDITGTDATVFLQKLLANDVAKLVQPGKALYSGMLNEAGGVIDDLIVYLRSAESYRMVINASTAASDLVHMRMVAAAFDVTITPLQETLAMLAVQGPNARAKVWQARPAWQVASASLLAFFAAEVEDVFIARTGYTGEDGFEIMLPSMDAAQLWQDLVAVGVHPCGLGARDTLRLEAGMNLYGNDMDQTISPLDAGMGWTVDTKTTRDFIGRRALVAAGKKYAFFGLKLLDRGVMRSHMKVISQQGEGHTTSATFSPTLNLSIALARMPLAVKIGDTVQVEIRAKLYPAVIVKLPFVRNGKALV